MSSAIGMGALTGHLATGGINKRYIQFISLNTVGNDIKLMLNPQGCLAAINAQCIHKQAPWGQSILFTLEEVADKTADEE